MIGSTNANVSPLIDVKVVRYETTITKTVGQSAMITAPSESGYTFVSWITCATNGWVGSVYIASPLQASTSAWLAATNSATGTGTIWCYALYKKKV